MDKPKAAIYCRISREDEQKKEESESIQNQKAMLLEFAQANGWEVYDVYCDEDYSGADHTRPDFLRLLADAQNRRFSIILCKTQSRFTRDIELVEEYIHRKFLLWGIRFVAVVDHIDTALDHNKKARQINGLINEWYLEDLSQNIKSVLDVKRRQGQYIGSFALYGYRKDPNDRHHLIPDKAAAQVVQSIFSWYLQGMGKLAIAKRLNEQGVLNPTAYKQAQGLMYRNGFQNPWGLWNKQSVSRILANEMYTGTLVQGKTRKVTYKSKQLVAVQPEEWVRIPNAHEAVVPPEVFKAVQQQMAAHTKPGAQGQKHPLAGLVFCEHCLSPMQKNQTVYKGHTRAYLQCKRYGAKGGCTSHGARLNDVLELVAQAVMERIERLYVWDVPALLEQAKKQSAPKPPSLPAPNAQEAVLLKALAQLYTDNAKGVLSAGQYAALHAQLAKELKEAQERQMLPSAPETAAKAPQQAGEWLKGRLCFAAPPYDLAHGLIEKVLIGEKSPDGQRVSIVWK